MKTPGPLKHVKFTRAKGKIYAYFNAGKDSTGKIIWRALPQWGSVGFYDSYSAMLGHRNRTAVTPMTVADLIGMYRESERHKGLSKGTRETYGATLRKIDHFLGEMPIDTVTRRHVREAAETFPGGATRNLFISVVGVLYSYARRDLECTKNDPAKDLDRYATGKHEAWPEAILNEALESEGRVRLAVHLLYYTGQRIGDVLRMRWDHIRDGIITVTQQKTGKVLHLPFLPELAAELARTPRVGMTILTGKNGRPLGYETLRQEIKAYTEARGFDVVAHGLRSNAVYVFLYAGCSPDEVGSFTGQSAEIVARYAKGIDQLRLAQGVVVKMNARAGTQGDSSNRIQTTIAKPQES